MHVENTVTFFNLLSSFPGSRKKHSLVRTVYFKLDRALWGELELMRIAYSCLELLVCKIRRGHRI